MFTYKEITYSGIGDWFKTNFHYLLNATSNDTVDNQWSNSKNWFRLFGVETILIIFFTFLVVKFVLRRLFRRK